MPVSIYPLLWLYSKLSPRHVPASKDAFPWPLSAATFYLTEGTGVRLCEVPGPLCSQTNMSTFLCLSSSENELTQRSRLQGIDHRGNLFKCPTVTALVTIKKARIERNNSCL